MDIRTIKAQKLSREGFEDFGSYFSVTEPAGYCLEGTYHRFYRDAIRIPAVSRPFCLSSLVVRRNEGFQINGMEYHDCTAEAQLPLDDDVILAVAPANGGELKREEVQAFFIPKGTAVCLNAGVWHDVMYPAAGDRVSVLIGLPERTYKNDITVLQFSDGAVRVEP